MPTKLDFVFTTEDVNRYGYWVRTDGISLVNYAKNPVFLFGHDHKKMSIGKISNLRAENGSLIGTVEFDEEDDDAMKIYKKYKNGYMNAVSISFGNIVWTEAEQFLKPGQKYATVYECELLEISAVNVPGNKNALIRLLNDNGTELNLSFLTMNNNNEPKSLDNKDKELQEELAQLKKERAVLLVDNNFQRGAITEPERLSFEEKAVADYENTKKELELKKGTETIKSFIAPTQTAPTAPKKFKEMSESERIALRANDKNAYSLAFAEEYGFTPTLE